MSAGNIEMLVFLSVFFPTMRIFKFLAVQNSSIGDLVTHWLTDWLTDSLSHWVTDSQYFYFWHTKSNTRDLWPLKHPIWDHRRHDLTEKNTYQPTDQPTYLPIFSCPEQLNRWPCHSLTHSLTDWLTHSLRVLLLLTFIESSLRLVRAEKT